MLQIVPGSKTIQAGSEEVIAQKIASDLNVSVKNVSQAIELLDAGDTIPFIARYRKEVTGSMSDEHLRLLEERLSQYRNLEKRREDVLRLIQEQEALTPELEQAIIKAKTVSELDDLYRPFRPKKRTRATIAEEKGLKPLALQIVRGEENIDLLAEQFISEEHGLLDQKSVISGAKDIIAELISDNPKVRRLLKRLIENEGEVVVTSKKKEQVQSSYEMYYNYREPLKAIKSHRVLAINRGEKEGFLNARISIPEERAIAVISAAYVPGEISSQAGQLLQEAVQDSWKRLIFPSLEREFRNELTETAEEKALVVFKDNLRNLLMAQPVKGKRFLAIDPGLRTGSKVAAVDENGKLLQTTVIYPAPPKNEKEKSAFVLKKMIKEHEVNAIAIGNGTGGREVEQFVAEMLKSENIKLPYIIVNEAGASVYSASKLGQEEFPGLDVAERSAVSIARRVQDPLAELVKIEPKSIGVGQYQHDVNQVRLKDTLSGVVESCVNLVGVNLNTASPALLGYVSGVNKNVAQNIVQYREANGYFRSRRELKKVPKLGPQAFKQCAGFLRVPESDNYLDRSAVHPESYETAEKLMQELAVSPESLGDPEHISEVDVAELAQKVGVGKPTVADILEEFKRPGRDPREDLPAPVFREGVLEIEDLKEGMHLSGVVRNVVDFGAFIDIGVHQDGLAHISELADQYVKHPADVLKVGDIVEVKVLGVDLERKRISLTLKV